VADIAIGCSRVALTQLAGRKDPHGHLLKPTHPAFVDEVAGAAELVMNKLSLVPVAIARDVERRRSESGVKSLVRKRSMDLFR